MIRGTPANTGLTPGEARTLAALPGTASDVARRIGSETRTVRNWLRSLRTQGFAVCGETGVWHKALP